MNWHAKLSNVKSQISKDWEKTALYAACATLFILGGTQIYKVYSLNASSPSGIHLKNDKKILALVQEKSTITKTTFKASQEFTTSLSKMKDTATQFNKTVTASRRPTLTNLSNQINIALNKIDFAEKNSFSENYARVGQLTSQIEKVLKNSVLPIQEVMALNNMLRGMNTHSKSLADAYQSSLTKQTEKRKKRDAVYGQISDIAEENIISTQLGSAAYNNHQNQVARTSAYFFLLSAGIIVGFYINSRKRKAQFEELKSFAQGVGKVSSHSMEDLKAGFISIANEVNLFEHGPFPMAILHGKNIYKMNANLRSELGFAEKDISWNSFHWDLLCKVFSIETSVDILNLNHTGTTKAYSKSKNGQLNEYCVVINPIQDKTAALISFIPVAYFRSLNEVSPMNISLPHIPDADSSLVNIVELAETAIESHKNLIYGKGLKVGINSEEECMVFGNRDKLLSAMKNLIGSVVLTVAKNSDSKNMLIDIQKNAEGTQMRIRIPDVKISQALLFETIDQSNGDLRCLEDSLNQFEKMVKDHDVSLDLKNNFDEADEFMYSSFDLSFGA